MPVTATIAHDAFIYGYPTVDLYSILYKYAGRSRLHPSTRRRSTRSTTPATSPRPQDTAIVAPNCDTPYSYAWLDLRAEPLVLSIPPFESNRYVSLMLVDLYTYIVGYVTPRTNGSTGGDFLVAGPDWAGSTPPGIKRVLQAPTQFALAFYRTQLFGPEDTAAVWKIQDQFRVQTLAQYTGAPAPAAAATPEWCPPLDVRKDPTSLRFFAVLNWMLQYMPPLEDERELRATFSAIGVEAAPDFAEPEPEQRTALLQGMQAGQGAMVDHLRTVKSSGELFGSREFLGHNYLSRAVGAMVGILGNSAEEFLGIGYPGDANGQPFDGSHCYTNQVLTRCHAAGEGVLVDHRLRRGRCCYMQTRSSAMSSTPPWSSSLCATPTAASRCTCSTTRLARTRRQTGCPYLPESSTSHSVPISRSRRSLTSPTMRHRSSWSA